MSVWKDARGRYHVGLMHRGQRVHRCCPEGTTREAAQRYETKLRHELFRVLDLGESPAIPLEQAIQRYLTDEVEHQKAAHITRLKAYALEPLVRGKTLAQIVDVAGALIAEGRGAGLASATINRKLSILKRVATLAYKKWGWLREPLADKIPRLAGERARHVYLSAAQIGRLVTDCRTQVCRDAVLIAAYTGLRQGELWSLRPAHYQGSVIYLADSKSGAPRSVPVIPKIRAALKRWLAAERPHPRTVYRDFEQARLRLGMPGLRFHDLRHTTASLLAAAGVDLGTIGSILGHASAQTTKRYAHLSIEAKRKALRKIG
jgi:integrase